MIMSLLSEGKALIFTQLSASALHTLSLSNPDIDECSQGSHMCHYNQQCVNTAGTYRCQAKCGSGFKPSITGSSCEGKSLLITAQMSAQHFIWRQNN